MANDLKDQYFSHDYNASFDIKIQAILSESGSAGYGIYWRLIEELHKGQLKLNEYTLKAIAEQMRTSVEQIRTVVQVGIECDLFYENGDNYLHCKRVERNLKKREELRQKRSKAGIASGKSRKNNENRTSVEQKLTHANTCSTMSNKKEQRKGKERKGKEIKKTNNAIKKSDDFSPLDTNLLKISKELTVELPDKFNNEKFKIAIRGFNRMRTKKRKPLTKNALVRLISRVEKLSQGDVNKAIKILNNSEDYGWTDIYPLKGEENAKFTTEGYKRSGRITF